MNILSVSRLVVLDVIPLSACPLHSIFYFCLPLNVLMLGGGINPFPSDNEPESVVGRVRYEMRSMDRSVVH